MRFFYLLCGLVLIVAVAAPFYMRGPSGAPLMSLDKFLKDSVVTLPELPGLPDLFSEPPEPVKVFRWQDSEGAWHFSDEAPADRVVEQIEVRPNLSPIKADWVAKLKALEPPPPAPAAGGETQAVPGEASVAGAYSGEALDQAKQAAELVQQHNDQLEQVMQDIKF